MRKETNMRLLKINFSTESILYYSSYAASIKEFFFRKSYAVHYTILSWELCFLRTAESRMKTIVHDEEATRS